MTSRFPYQDASLDIDNRVEDLLARMSLADKAGLFFQTMTTSGDPHTGEPAFGLPPLASMVEGKRMNHFNLFGAPGTARELAQWYNAAQQLAAGVGLGIPITISTDPRHGFSDNPGTAMMAGPFSQWPETLGFAAIGSVERMQEFADIARREYLAVGIRLALHPQIDLTTEPRWARCNGTFGEDADLTSRLVVGYIRGFQGAQLGPGSVATMVKHFPGGGPQKDGEDPHFDYGREQVYPGDNFDYHLRPFKAAIAAGGSQMMPYYGMPVGTDYEEVGFGFNKGILTDLLREKLGFTGIVCTDWGLLSDAEIMGQPMPARAWGLEHLTREERMLKALDAGVDQFGGEMCPQVLISLVESGQVAEGRLDVSARRLLREKFVLGLFDQPYVDADAAATVVGCQDFVEAGLAAQRDSITLLVNRTDDGAARLPLAGGLRVYTEGLDADAAGEYATVVSDPSQADVAIIRIKAPFEPRTGGFEAFFHAGSLEFPAEEIDRLTTLCQQVPTVVDVYLDRPAVLTDLVAQAAALVVDYGACDRALLDVVFGRSAPLGSLPFDLPRSMAAVEASREDMPFDTKDPIFRFGDGLRY